MFLTQFMDQKNNARKPVSRRKVWGSFVFIVILSVVCALIATPHIPERFWASKFFNSFTPHLGLDLKGGAQLVYQADLSRVPIGDVREAIEGARDVIERRVNAFGVGEPSVTTSGQDRIIIELPGISDLKDAIKKIGETPILEFKEAKTEAEIDTEASKFEGDAEKINKSMKELADKTLAEVKAGKDFATLAKERSQDGTRDNGGQLDWARKGMYVKEFEDVVFGKLKNKGELFPSLVKSQFGYHIIKLDDVREVDVPATDGKPASKEKEVKVSHILFKIRTSKDLLAALGDTVMWKTTGLSGTQLKSAKVIFDQNTSTPLVQLAFNDEGKKLFEDITGRNVGKQVAIFLDGSVLSAPRVSEKIIGGDAVITNMENAQVAKELARRLSAGALPVPITLLSQQTIGPTLGAESVHTSIVAGLIGLILVSVFMIVFYRFLGLISVIALGVYSVILLALFEFIPITLTLAGVAGYLLSVGMAVDANILIFERTKEELRAGHPFSVAIEEGFLRAWNSIRDSNVSSLITCAILYFTSTSMIQGFAVTLGLGILVSIFTAINVTRTILRLVTVPAFIRHNKFFIIE